MSPVNIWTNNGQKMDIVTAGINHKTASLETRERFFLRPAERELLLSELRSEPLVVGAFILSTCNRTEICAQMLERDAELLLRHLFAVKKIFMTLELTAHFYEYCAEDAVRHLLDVVTGLDSLVLGEKQILGQVKEAAELARKKGMMSKQLNILSNITIRTGKKAQQETQISCGGSSVSWAAVTMAEKILGTLRDKTVLIIGAGKMSQLTACQLGRKKVGRVFIMNRSMDKGEALARQLNGSAVSFWNIKEVLMEVDVCICSAGAPHYLVEKDLVEKVMSRRRSKGMILIDISTPRNINPAVATVEGATLVSIDDLENVVKENLQKRQAAIRQVRQIIASKINEYYAKTAPVPVALPEAVCGVKGGS